MAAAETSKLAVTPAATSKPRIKAVAGRAKAKAESAVAAVKKAISPLAKSKETASYRENAAVA